MKPLKREKKSTARSAAIGDQRDAGAGRAAEGREAGVEEPTARAAMPRSAVSERKRSSLKVNAPLLSSPLQGDRFGRGLCVRSAGNRRSIRDVLPGAEPAG